jgi:hypothetical protein
MRPRIVIAGIAALVGLLAAALLVAGCAGAGGSTPTIAPSATATSTPMPPSAASSSAPLPDTAYYLWPGLPSWVDTQTGYDTAKQWDLSGGTWPVAVFMNPAQAPQLLAGMKAGVYQSKLKPFGITPVVEPIDGPPRAWHALQRSKWPFAYVPLTVYLNFVRTQHNEGGAGGLQYVVIAGSAAGGSQTLLAHDPKIKTVADLKGKTVGMSMGSPVRGVLLEDAAAAVGLKVGTGPDDIHIDMTYKSNSDVLNGYAAKEYDAVISMSITKAALIEMGSHRVTGFPDTPTTMALVVERTVLEQRPDVVKAFLESHYEGQRLVVPTWDTDGLAMLMQGWNAYFKSQPDLPQSPQRLVSTVAEYRTLLADVRPDDRVRRDYLTKCFKFIDAYKMWDWRGVVDTSKLVDYDLYNEVLKAHGETTLQ